jgi:hypothetical protein
VLANILSPDKKVKISNVMNGVADHVSTESTSCEEEESGDNDSSLDTLVEIEIDDDAASDVLAGLSSSDSSDESNTGTTQGSLPSDEDPIDVGDLDDGSLGSSGDPNSYCSISDEESSDNESTDNEEGNESNASPTLTEEDNKSTEEDSDNASPALIEEDDASTADDNGRLESSSNEVEDAQENQVRKSTRICTRRG